MFSPEVFVAWVATSGTTTAAGTNRGREAETVYTAPGDDETGRRWIVSDAIASGVTAGHN